MSSPEDEKDSGVVQICPTAFTSSRSKMQTSLTLECLKPVNSGIQDNQPNNRVVGTVSLPKAKMRGLKCYHKGAY